jgi:SAM-dependent methyltransferase
MNIWRQGLTKENVADLISTGFKGKPHEMTPSLIVGNYLKGGDSILDFGCGVGRNTFYLKDFYKNVVGYDLPTMLKFYPENFKAENIRLTSDWESLKKEKFDACLASLVFQHIPKHELEIYLIDLTKMVSNLLLLSRDWQDFDGGRTLNIIKKYFTLLDYKKTGSDHFISYIKPKT